MIYTYQELVMWALNAVIWRFLIPMVIALIVGAVLFGFLKTAKRKQSNP